MRLFDFDITNVEPESMVSKHRIKKIMIFCLAPDKCSWEQTCVFNDLRGCIEEY